MMEIGTKIYNLRTQRGMTLEELGKKVGVSKSTVRKWEQGIIANMKRDKIAKLAFALGCSPAYLMGWDEDAITTAETIQDEVLSASESLAAENVDLYNELLDLTLTRDELLDVLRYANYVKSLRK